MIIEDIPKRNARRYPDKVALAFGNNRYTFRELNERINSFANALTNMGLKKGDTLAIVADNCNQYMELFWVAAKTGMVMAPLNPNLTQQELAGLICNAGAKIVVFSQSYQNLIESLRSQVAGVQEYITIGAPVEGAKSYEELVSSQPPLEPEVQTDDDDLLFVGSTGGTTGLSKQVMHTYRSILVTALEDIHASELKSRDVLLFAGPFFWALALLRILVPGFYMGCSIGIIQEFTPQCILQAIEREGVSVLLSGTSSIYNLVGYPDLDKYDRSSLRRILATGAPLPKEFWRRAVDTFGNIFTLLYGLCEFPHVSLLPPEDFVFEGSEEQTNKVRSCGREATNTEVRVVDEQGNDIQPGQVGEVIATSPCMMKGYLNAPRATEETIKRGYVYTGDLATVDKDGYIYLTGRKKDVITTQGKMLIPMEVEDVIYSHPEVFETVVIGVPDETLGEAIKAVVVLKKGGRATEKEIIELCQQHLPDYAVPKSVDFVERLPRSPTTGKILRRMLRDRYAEV